MRTALLDPADQAWAPLVESVAADIYYLPGYVAACARREGGRPLLFVASEGGNLWLQPLIVREIPEQGPGGGRARPILDAVSPYGYSGPLISVVDGSADMWEKRAVRQFRDCLASEGVITAFIRLHPILNRAVAGVGAHESLTLRGRTVLVDLSKSAERQWGELRENHRRHINRARRAGFVAAIEGDAGKFPMFRDIYLESMDRVGGSSYHRALVEDLPELAAQNASNFYVSAVRLGGDIACMGLFTEKGGIVQYHLGATANKYIRYSPSKLMIQHAIEVARERGNHLFHLGGGIGGADGSLFHFKAGFSSEVLPFYTWDVVVDQAEYGALLSRISPLSPDSAGEDDHYFPRYRASRFDAQQAGAAAGGAVRAKSLVMM